MASPFRPSISDFRTPTSLALLEIGNLSPAFVVADRCAKAADVRIIAIESTDSTAQCIKLAGPTDDV
ncbi:MAG TPA: BMC domain-containing protein, partial [Pirellulales bacterium]|nr:BMC domain-containing protein [Pirellulales bacterium]